jgi:hypothetical protein
VAHKAKEDAPFGHIADAGEAVQAGLEQCANLSLWNHRKNFVPTDFLVLNDSFLRFR